LPDQARGMPGRAVGDAALLEHDDVALALLGEVVRDRAADRAGADDDDARGVGERGHASTPRRRFRSDTLRLARDRAQRRLAADLGEVPVDEVLYVALEGLGERAGLVARR